MTQIFLMTYFLLYLRDLRNLRETIKLRGLYIIVTQITQKAQMFLMA